MRHLYWSIRYFYFMNKNIRDFRFSFYLTRVAHIEVENWMDDDPEFCVLEELSYWGD